MRPPKCKQDVRCVFRLKYFNNFPSCLLLLQPILYIEQNMNIVVPEKLDGNGLRWLFIDMNSYFAACEQQDNVALRGKPIVVVQTLAESACCIAASYEAKRMGIKTGAMLSEARRLCSGVIPVLAQHKLYSHYHARILQAIDTCLPIERICSIDEVACRLTVSEQQPQAALALAMTIKRVLRERVGECMSCSIGIAPNAFLGKVASDMQKPDGLVMITQNSLPDILLPLALRDIYGIGRRMEERLHRAGIQTVAQLWQASTGQLRQVWGGINGVLFHQMLHGVDVQASVSSQTKSMGHQHVLEPAMRTNAGAKNFARHLLTKVGERLRRDHYYCCRLVVWLSFMGDAGHWEDAMSFHQTQDTGFLMARFEQLWLRVPPTKPFAVGVVLHRLVPAINHQPDLFVHNAKQERLTPMIDAINNKYGRCTIGLGLLPEKVRQFKGHAAFSRVPELWEF
jgi:DNA polymerase-4